MELFESPDQTPLGFCLLGWMKDEGYKRKVDTPDEFLARILNAAACITKHEDRRRRTTGDLHTRVARCIEDQGDIFEHLL
jgi:hypothetical protein